MPMEENKKLPQRKKTHLKPSMYLDGWYFVTMVAVGREHIFSKIEINEKSSYCRLEKQQFDV